MEPLYLEARRTGLLGERIAEARGHLQACDLCPRSCGVDRLAGERGVCQGGAGIEISSAGPHFGEEPPLVGWGGSGTIFLTHCNMRCIFCQNYDISHHGRGTAVTVSQMADTMLNLQRCGCHNVNLVTPTHVLPQILEALDEAAAEGLSIPLVWNCGGYESAGILPLLEGVVDIYMPDVKFGGRESGVRFCGVPDYFERVREAVGEMHRQVGDLLVDGNGIAQRGLLVRHLVMPEGLAGTAEVVRFLGEEISRDCYLNIMDQYRPCHRAFEHPDLARRIRAEEYRQAVETARGAGLHRGLA